MDPKIFAQEMINALENVTFVRTPKGFQLKKERYFSNKEKMLINPTYAKSLHHCIEFTRVIKSCVTLRRAVNHLMTNAKNNKTSTVGVKRLFEILKTDNINLIPHRNIHHGDTTLLRNLDLNFYSTLSSIFYAELSTRIEREGGYLILNIPSFRPDIMLKKVSGATHFKILSAGCEIDFLNHQSITDYKETPELLLNEIPTDSVCHIHSISPGSLLPLFIIIGVRYYQLVNGIFYPLMSKVINPITIIAVDKLE